MYYIVVTPPPLSPLPSLLLTIPLSLLWYDTGQLAKEQTRRRAREWSLRTLRTHREALLREEREEVERQRHLLAETRRMEEEERRHEMINHALSCDAKWAQHEHDTQSLRNQSRFDSAELKWLPRFDKDNPAAPTREHPHSWRLHAYGGKHGNLPIEKQAAVQVRHSIWCWRRFSLLCVVGDGSSCACHYGVCGWLDIYCVIRCIM